MAKYKAYPEYKDSGVEWLGAIPEDWSVTKLKYIADLLTAKSTNSDDLFVGLENISSGDGKYISKEENIADGASVSFEKNDVLFGKLRPYLAKSWLATFSGVCSSEFLVLRTAKLHPKYLNYFSLTNEFIDQVNSSTYGSKMPRASWEFIGLLPVPTCSYSLSEKVARFLDHETAKIDNLIEKQQQLIELLKEKRQAVISHAVTKGLNSDVPMKDSGVEWLGKVPEHWSINNLSHVLSAIGDVDHFMPRSVEDCIPYIMTGDLTEFASGIKFGQCKQVSRQDYLKLSKKIKTTMGDVIMARYATIGTVSYVDIDKEFLVSYSCVTIKPDLFRVIGIYLFYYFKSISFLQGIQYQVNTNTQGNVGINDLNKMKIVLPDINEQQKIISHLQMNLQSLDDLSEKATQAINLMKERRTALITAAVTGKIDVRDWVAPDTQDVEEPQEATA